MALSFTPSGPCPAYDSNGFCVTDPLRFQFTPNPSNPSWFSDPLPLSQAIAAGIPQNPNASNPNPTQPGQQGFFSNPFTYDFGPSIDKLLNQIPLIGPMNSSIGSTADPNSRASQAVAQAGNFLSFIADIPRLGTFVLAIIVTAAGFYMLGNKQVVSIVDSARKSVGV